MKVKRKIIKIDEELCDGCGSCVPACAEGALAVVNGKARVIADKFCDGLGACLGECPRGALHIIEREAEEFDEEAVADHLKKQPKTDTLPCGCPSSRVETLAPSPRTTNKHPKESYGTTPSALANWPVQIRLVPPDAPFLKNADLLVISDCTPLAYPDFHRDFLKGRVVLMGCPKFDDRELYIDKFAEIFKRSGIRSITAVVMEVPCCQGMPVILKEALQRARKKIPLETVILGIRGTVLQTVHAAP